MSEYLILSSGRRYRGGGPPPDPIGAIIAIVVLIIGIGIAWLNKHGIPIWMQSEWVLLILCGLPIMAFFITIIIITERDL